MLLFPFIAFGQTITLSDADIKAFYGAVGHGANATGGRGQNVYLVINTNAEGPGSLDAAITQAETNGGGIIVFRVSGTIDLSSKSTTTRNIVSTASNLTIAGETAPGQGIAIHGGPLWIQNAENVIIRHIRIRPGDNATQEDGLRVVMFSAADTMNSNYVIDHCSISWSTDEAVAFEGLFHDLENITFSNNIVSEPFGSQYGFLLYGSNDSSEGVNNVSIIGNLFAHVNSRNVESTTSNVSFEGINNVMYNHTATWRLVSNNRFDIINNVMEDGPATLSLGSVRMEQCINCSPVITGVGTASGYINGNTFNGGSITITDAVDGSINDVLQVARQVSSGYTPMATSAVKDYVLSNVGARAGLSGGRDSYDLQVVSNAESGLGFTNGNFPANEAQATASLPTLASGTPYVDSDGDGLSDEYERKNGGSEPTWAVSPSTRPATAQLVSGVTIDQTAVTAGIRYTHMDIFLGELAGDWTGGSSGGGGTNDPATDKGRSGTSAMLIAH